MFSSYSEYEKYIDSLNSNKVRIESHHLAPLRTGGEDVSYNLLRLLDKDHTMVHQVLDPKGGAIGTMSREQRKKQNGHIVLTQDDINGKEFIQHKYFDKLYDLPKFIVDAHENKIIDRAIEWNKKLKMITGGTHAIDDTDFFKTFECCISIEKEISRELYNIINKRKKIYI